MTKIHYVDENGKHLFFDTSIPSDQALISGYFKWQWYYKNTHAISPFVIAPVEWNNGKNGQVLSLFTKTFILKNQFLSTYAPLEKLVEGAFVHGTKNPLYVNAKWRKNGKFFQLFSSRDINPGEQIIILDEENGADFSVPASLESVVGQFNASQDNWGIRLFNNKEQGYSLSFFKRPTLIATLPGSGEREDFVSDIPRP